MARNSNSKKSEGMWKKMYNVLIPFSATSRRNSHQNPTKNTSPRISKMIPVESFPKNKKVESFGDREIVIVNGQKVAKSANNGKVEKVGSNAKYKKDDDFSEYIRKVRSRMKKAASSIGGGERADSKRDSFDDKVGSYISHAKAKIRTTTTTNAGHNHEKINASFK